MTRLSEIETHIASMDGMLDIVGAMRSLAGMRMQEALKALPAVRRYGDGLKTGVAEARALVAPAERASASAGGATAHVLCMAEHGFVGAFNETLNETARHTVAAGDVLFVLGSRGAALAVERGLDVAWMHPMASRASAVPRMVQVLLAELYAQIARGTLTRVSVIYTRYQSAGAPEIVKRTILPLDPAALEASSARLPPLHNLAPLRLLEKLMAEYVFAELSEAAVESIASENAARFAAMESAHENVSKKLDKLRQDARTARQSEITTELIELVTGAEAATSAPGL